jgi:hypothetical protein
MCHTVAVAGQPRARRIRDPPAGAAFDRPGENGGVRRPATGDPGKEIHMTASFTVSPSPMPIAGIDPDAAYQPGVCNIGPDEIRRRRRSGHVGLSAAVGLFAVLVVVGAPPIARALVGLPAVIAASGYLQAHLRFCAGFGQLGVFNFGTVGEAEHVEDPEARAKDRAKAHQIGLMSFAVGIVVAIVAVTVPL